MVGGAELHSLTKQAGGRVEGGRREGRVLSTAQRHGLTAEVDEVG
jgi:hypothetical protein